MAANATLIPLFLHSWVQLIVPGDCFDEFFVKFNFLDLPCLKIVISKCLGYAIIVGSCIVRVPQVIKIFQAKSGAGISLTSLFLELAAISFSWAYGFGHKFPFSAYGEAVFLAIQVVAILVLIMVYSGQSFFAISFLSLYVGTIAFLLSPSVPMQLLVLLQASNIALVIIGKFVQVVANLRNSGTGQLSLVTYLLLFLGSVARIFTSLQETGDAMVVISYVAASTLNGAVVGQILYYWNKAAKSAPGQKETKKMK